MARKKSEHMPAANAVGARQAERDHAERTRMHVGTPRHVQRRVQEDAEDARTYTNGCAKGESFSALHRARVQRMLDVVKAVHPGACGAPEFMLTLSIPGWQWVASIQVAEGRTYSGSSIKSPEHALDVLEAAIRSTVQTRADVLEKQLQSLRKIRGL